jgi:hypothetical protein
MCLFTRSCPCAVCGQNFEPRRTRSTPGRSLVRDHSFYFGGVGVTYQHRPTQVSLTFLVFRRQDVAQIRLGALHFSSRGLLEALGSAFVSFQFWHRLYVLIRPGWPAARAFGPVQLFVAAEPEPAGPASPPASSRSEPGSDAAYCLPVVAEILRSRYQRYL